MSYLILERVDVPLPHLESKWIFRCSTFLAPISASLHLDNPCLPQPQREHDCYLMDMIIQSAQFTPQQIKLLLRPFRNRMDRSLQPRPPFRERAEDVDLSKSDLERLRRVSSLASWRVALPSTGSLFSILRVCT